MRSPASSEPLDLERGLRVTPEDVAALRRMPRPTPEFGEFLAWLSSLPSPTHATLKSRGGPKGKPFVLRS
jgi:hypothetical protein